MPKFGLSFPTRSKHQAVHPAPAGCSSLEQLHNDVETRVASTRDVVLDLIRQTGGAAAVESQLKAQKAAWKFQGQKEAFYECEWPTCAAGLCCPPHHALSRELSGLRCLLACANNRRSTELMHAACTPCSCCPDLRTFSNASDFVNHDFQSDIKLADNALKAIKDDIKERQGTIEKVSHRACHIIRHGAYSWQRQAEPHLL